LIAACDEEIQDRSRSACLPLLGSKTLVMAVLNATPDSFSGDGLIGQPAVAAERAVDAAADGADIIDIGAESTRPGFTPIEPQMEIDRLLPIMRAVSTRVDIPISVDTSKAAVAEAAIGAGASMINDVRGLTGDPELGQVIATHGVSAVLMHDLAPDPRLDLLTAIHRELARRLELAVKAGIAWDRLIIDPGFGFAKTWRQNLELLRRLSELRSLGRPILVGTSRKGTIGRVLRLPADDRVEGTAATLALAIAGGADIVRVHDVRPMARVTRMTDAVVRGDKWEGWAGLE
jgi:dihydropteroate synthase